ncbi:DUF1850 domain-containing protein [Nitratireductor sp. ZSWI3]|uniref:DUF1850 domain-containing protein n=1 Tax=Nitratireductor sp. ZSWI3 TaxID=2966359 RepID=UPI00214F6758|nr:DUF1850 domain-containing protein [Nitratireductor sp. ZSWI3]MCR4266385.1 DUF1850 domain-containing protein [Nitratireductor sp. ZSWI3]
MSLCVLAGGKAATIAATLFTLSWTHSVEKIRWEEHWRVTPAGLEVLQARVQGSGAGMEPPPEARFDNGWWVYEPALPPLPEIRLAASGATGESWLLCAGGRCMTLGASAGAPVILKPCG